MLDPELKEYIKTGGNSRNAVRGRKRLWTSRIIPYRVPSHMGMFIFKDIWLMDHSLLIREEGEGVRAEEFGKDPMVSFFLFSFFFFFFFHNIWKGGIQKPTLMSDLSQLFGPFCVRTQQSFPSPTNELVISSTCKQRTEQNNHNFSCER